MQDDGAKSAGETGLRDDLCGPLAALVTPMHEDGGLNLDAFEPHVEFQVCHGVRALVVNGSVGEAPSLSVAERKATAEAVLELAKGCTRTFVSVTHDTWSESMALADHAASHGADGLLASVPSFFKLTEDEQLIYWRRMAEASPLPFIIYCSGHGASPRASPDLLSEVVKLPNVLAIKEASPDVSRMRELVARFGPEVPIIAAGEKTLPAALRVGAAAAMTASVCFAPARISAMFEAIERGQDAESIFKPIQRFRAPFQEAMDRGFPRYIPYTKAACEVVGLSSGPPRTPLLPIEGAECERAAPLIRLVADAPG